MLYAGAKKPLNTRKAPVCIRYRKCYKRGLKSALNSEPKV